MSCTQWHSIEALHKCLSALGARDDFCSLIKADSLSIVRGRRSTSSCRLNWAATPLITASIAIDKNFFNNIVKGSPADGLIKWPNQNACKPKMLLLLLSKEHQAIKCQEYATACAAERTGTLYDPSWAPGDAWDPIFLREGWWARTDSGAHNEPNLVWSGVGGRIRCQLLFVLWLGTRWSWLLRPALGVNRDGWRGSAKSRADLERLYKWNSGGLDGDNEVQSHSLQRRHDRVEISPQESR